MLKRSRPVRWFLVPVPAAALGLGMWGGYVAAGIAMMAARWISS